MACKGSSYLHPQPKAAGQGYWEDSQLAAASSAAGAAKGGASLVLISDFVLLQTRLDGLIRSELI